MSTEQKVLGIGGIVTLAILIGGVFLLSKGNSGSSVPPEQIVAQNGLHWHPKLTITLDGKKQELPSGIGMTGSIHQEMHTHDEDAKDGVVHMEMNGLVTKDETTLGSFFRVWGKKFSSTQILDTVSTSEGEIKMLVNGKENNQYENYEMKDKDQIEIRYE